MKDYKGFRLYISLGPSKVRRRLKGHGFGVKKVQSAGRNQAVIIHTATGEHFRQLKQLFADVRVSESEAEINRPLESLSNPDIENDDRLLTEQEHHVPGQEPPGTTRADAKRD